MEPISTAVVSSVGRIAAAAIGRSKGTSNRRRLVKLHLDVDVSPGEHSSKVALTLRLPEGTQETVRVLSIRSRVRVSVDECAEPPFEPAPYLAQGARPSSPFDVSPSSGPKRWDCTISHLPLSATARDLRAKRAALVYGSRGVEALASLDGEDIALLRRPGWIGGLFRAVGALEPKGTEIKFEVVTAQDGKQLTKAIRLPAESYWSRLRRLQSQIAETSTHPGFAGPA